MTNNKEKFEQEFKNLAPETSDKTLQYLNEISIEEDKFGNRHTIVQQVKHSLNDPAEYYMRLQSQISALQTGLNNVYEKFQVVEQLMRVQGNLQSSGMLDNTASRALLEAYNELQNQPLIEAENREPIDLGATNLHAAKKDWKAEADVEPTIEPKIPFYKKIFK